MRAHATNLRRRTFTMDRDMLYPRPEARSEPAARTEPERPNRTVLRQRRAGRTPEKATGARPLMAATSGLMTARRRRVSREVRTG